MDLFFSFTNYYAGTKMLRFFISVVFYSENLNSDIGSSRLIHSHNHKLANKQINNISFFFGYKFRAVSFNFWMLGLKRYTFLENPIIMCVQLTLTAVIPILPNLQ